MEFKEGQDTEKITFIPGLTYTIHDVSQRFLEPPEMEIQQPFLVISY